MISLQQIEQDLTRALKAKDSLTVNTLRGLKVRIQNEQIAKKSAKGGAASGGDLDEGEIFALVQSEIKRRKEAAEAFTGGERAEQAAQELAEAKVLEQYLPPQMGEAELRSVIETIISEQQFAAKDFGKAMGAVKAKVGNQADSAAIAKILKEKLT